MFSATFGDAIQHVASDILKSNYYFVRVGEINRPADTVEQTFIKVSFIFNLILLFCSE